LEILSSNQTSILQAWAHQLHGPFTLEQGHPSYSFDFPITASAGDVLRCCHLPPAYRESHTAAARDDSQPPTHGPTNLFLIGKTSAPASTSTSTYHGWYVLNPQAALSIPILPGFPICSAINHVSLCVCVCMIYMGGAEDYEQEQEMEVEAL
jgi:hypothetical protein